MPKKIYTDLEAPLIKVLAAMEREGVNLDVPYLKEYSKTLDADIAQLETAIAQQAGETFNLASPKQLGDILFEKLKIDSKPKKTKTGQYATSEEVLAPFAAKHKIVAEYIGMATSAETQIYLCRCTTVRGEQKYGSRTYYLYANSSRYRATQ